MNIYEELKKHLAKELSPVGMEHVAWVTDPDDLCNEILDAYNRNSEVAPSVLTMDDLDDWMKYLSTDEKDNYKGYLKMLGFEGIPKNERSIRAVALSQDPDHIPMAGSNHTLPTFTKDSTKRIMLTHLDRWITASEKMAVTGFPVHQE